MVRDLASEPSTPAADGLGGKSRGQEPRERDAVPEGVRAPSPPLSSLSPQRGEGGVKVG